MPDIALPQIIQGGMGVAISNWQLARSVSLMGQLGVVSGTGVSIVFARRLADGDPDGSLREALRHFPFQDQVQEILERYFIPGGKAPDAPYKLPSMYSIKPPKALDALTVISNFVEVFLAKQGHDGFIGINLLEKVQLPTMASLYGAMLAGVDVVLMGAGIPMQIAGILDRLSQHQKVSYRLDVLNADKDDDFRIEFDPEAIFPGITETMGTLKRPQFLPIISSVVLAQALLKRSEGKINGFVIEGPLAGGHNAPPRGALTLNERGEPIYGEKDNVDLEKMKQLGLPFWLAGSYGSHAGLQKALDAGAAGIQVGTAFAFCDDSGLDAGIRRRILDQVLAGKARVFTSPTASPTGFPFKVVELDGTLFEPTVYASRDRICDLGFLRSTVKRADGTLIYRCAAEPVEDYLRKGGAVEDTVNRNCLCNGLGATAGFPQARKDGKIEPPIVTSGDDLPNVAQFMPPGADHYSARDVIQTLLVGSLQPA
jgi:nitronate monooxygenase